MSDNIFQPGPRKSGFLRTGLVFSDPVWKDLLDQPWLKYVGMKTALRVSIPYVQGILKSVPQTPGRNVVVDVKPAWINKGEYPCNKGLHFDMVVSGSSATSQPERHWLVVFGPHCLTQFVVGDFVWDKSMHLSTVAPPGTEMVRAPHGEFILYDREGFHQGPEALDSGPRLLIRVTESDTLSPQPVGSGNDPRHLRNHREKINVL